MRLSVSDLLADRHSVRVLPFREWLHPLAEDVTPVGPVEGELMLSGTGGTVCLSGRIRTIVELTCGACLGRFQQPLEVVVVEEFGPGSAPVPVESRGEQELRSDDFVVPLQPGDMVDLTDVVRQHLVLALPIAPRCSQTCRGLCPRCGINRNTGTCICEDREIDPRLAPLEGWFSRRTQGGSKGRSRRERE